MEQERMRMPSNSKAKIELPLQLLTNSSKAEPIVITVDAADPNEPMAKGKEEAGKPLYLKRV
jgi:hypothetical protein